MKQFSEVSNLINKLGYRFSRGNFTFKIARDFIIFFIILKVSKDFDVLKTTPPLFWRSTTMRVLLDGY